MSFARGMVLMAFTAWALYAAGLPHASACWTLTIFAASAVLGCFLGARMLRREERRTAATSRRYGYGRTLTDARPQVDLDGCPFEEDDENA